MNKYSPSGNLAKKAAEQFGQFFGKEFKKPGKNPDPAAALPMRKPQTGIDKQFGPGDKVV